MVSRGAVVMMCDAIENRSLTMVKQILDSGFDPDQILVSDMKETGLHQAARYHSADMCKLFIDAGAKVDVKNKYGDSPLYVAIDMARPLDIVRAFIEAGANVRWKDKKNQTLLHKAAGRDNESQDFSPELCQLLLDSGADLFALTVAKRSVLHCAQHLQAWEFFTRAGIAPDFVPTGAGSGYLTPFQQALMVNRTDIVAACVASGNVDLDQRTLSGQSLWSLPSDPQTLAVLLAGQTTKNIAESVYAGASDTTAPRRPQPSPL